jgi:nitroimidazol reductase NimA-like FMN-containing flavoprotein (pyridoxamine 5'-phosphate oxidase superfamily)
MKEFPKTPLNTVRRLSKRGQYDETTVYSIIDESLICHVGFSVNGEPFVMPTIHARIDSTIYFHGAIANRMLKHIQEGNSVCISCALVDGIVFARSVFHHSMNYRSVVVFGKGRTVESVEEKDIAFKAITDHVAKGRWEEARIPSSKEINATLVIAVEIESASAKVRTGPAIDDEEDYSLPVWAGVLPIRQIPMAPEPDSRLDGKVDVPDYIKNYKR